MEQIKMTPRAPTLEEYPNILKFLNETLRPQATWSIQNEYPTALNQENIHNIRIISEGEKVLSHALVKPYILKSPAAIYKVGAIGSVVTHSEYRNKGLSKTIIEECLDICKKQKCDFAILWTNLFDFYKKIGFSLAGYEINLTIDQDFVPPQQNVKILKTSQIDPAAILKLMNQHSVMTIRSVEDVRRLMNIPSSSIYTAWDSNSQICAYAIEGKGADLHGYVHEWGGQVSVLAHLFSYIQKEKNAPIHVISPQHSQNLIQTLTSYGAKQVNGFLGMIKLIEEEELFKKIQKYAKLSHGINNLVLEKSNGEYKIGTTSQHLTTPNESDIVGLMFGPHQFSQIEGFTEQNVTILNKIFPLPLWLWGWDSI